MTSSSVDPLQQKSSSCCELEELNKRLPLNVRTQISVQSNDFKRRLMHESGLSSNCSEYLLLRSVLTHLHFAKEDYCTKTGQKLYAVVAGSYAAFLGGVVKAYNDVDIFVIVTDADLVAFESLWELIKLYRPGCKSSYYFTCNGPPILTVKDFGKVQIIAKYHSEGCLCDYHLNGVFFASFHHCTRWKLDVYNDFFVPRYMHMRMDNIVCRGTAIEPLSYDKRSIGDRQHIKKKEKKYPSKHVNNVKDFGPPSLKQQSLNVLLQKKCGCKDGGSTLNTTKLCNCCCCIGEYLTI